MIIKNRNDGRVRRTEDGLTQTVTWIVVLQTTDGTIARQSDILRDPRIPKHGEPHPTENIQVVDTTVEWLEGGNAEALITLQYGKPPEEQGGSFKSKLKADSKGPTVIRGSFRLREIDQYQDLDKNRFQLDPPASVIDDGERTAQEKQSEWASIKVQIPTHVVQHERLEDSHPAERARKVVGKRNNSAEGPYKAKTLLCDGVDYRSDDGGKTFQVTYLFSEDETFKHDVGELHWVDPRTGQAHPDNSTDIPDGASFPSKREDIEIFATANFGNELAIDFDAKPIISNT